MAPSTRIIVITFSFIAYFLPFQVKGVGFEVFGAKGRQRRASATATNWCYDNDTCIQGVATSDWELGVCKSGLRQSPIDIPTKTDLDDACPLDLGMTKENGYVLNGYSVVNLGKTLQVNVAGNDATFRYPSENDGTYELAQIHFHWGVTDAVGSEHTIGGKATSVEMHMVHYRSAGPDSYADAASAVASGKGDALAVIGVMLQADAGTTTSFLDTLEPLFDKVPNNGDKTTSNVPWDVGVILKGQTKAYTYPGSLTTPECNEVVSWIVCDTTVKISLKNVEKFRAITKQNNTFRYVAPLNGRSVKLVEIFH